MSDPAYLARSCRARLDDYRKKAARLRHINSQKLTRYTGLANVSTALLVIVSSTVTFMGFAGSDQLVRYARWLDGDVSRARVEFWFNLSLLTVVVLIILDLVYRFRERASEHNHAVVCLANFVNRLDDEIVVAVASGTEGELLKQTAARYEVMAEFLPSNTDRQYRRSKKTDPEPPKVSSSPAAAPPQVWTSDAASVAALSTIVLGAGWRVEVLRVLRATRADAVIAGGFVRIPVWDWVSGFTVPTAIADIDVLYYDRSHDASAERRIEGLLVNKLPNVRWQVKNQALPQRWHTGDPMPVSLEASLARAPETVSAVGIRQGSRGHGLEITAPLGVSDLFRMVVRPPSSASPGERRRFDARYGAKHWSLQWPLVTRCD